MSYKILSLKTKYRELYNNNNFVLLKNYFNREEVDKLKSYSNDIQQNMNININKKLYYDNNIKTKNTYSYFLNKHKPLNDFIKYKLNPIINNVYGKQVTLFNDTIYIYPEYCSGNNGTCDILKYSNYKPKEYITVMLFNGNNTIEIAKDFTINNSDFNEFNEFNTIKENILNWTPINCDSRDILIFNSNLHYRINNNKNNKIKSIFKFTYNKIYDGDFYDTFN